MSWRSISPTSWTSSPIAGVARAAETAVTSLLSEVIAIYCTIVLMDRGWVDVPAATSVATTTTLSELLAEKGNL